MFIPDKEACKPDLLATTGEFLRIWHIGEEGVTLQRLLNNVSSFCLQQNESCERQPLPAMLQNKQSEFCAPLTSFDWNEADPKRLGTSSIDTTCTIWDIEVTHLSLCLFKRGHRAPETALRSQKGEVDTQLIAHDKEVYDIAWGGLGVFATVSADGSVRIFDLRDKEHSTIIYESPTPETPLLRLSWNKQDPRYMATLLMDSSKVVILDIRFPTLPIAELQRHQAPVNSLSWAPHSSAHICTAGDDCQVRANCLGAEMNAGLNPCMQALIWDMSTNSQDAGQGLDPILAYNAGQEINQLQWSDLQPDWVAINFGFNTQILRCVRPFHGCAVCEDCEGGCQLWGLITSSLHMPQQGLRSRRPRL